MLKPWQKIFQKIKIPNKWWTYIVDEVMLPSGKSGEYYYVHTNGSSMVIPVFDDGRIILVKQFRYLADTTSLEFPCGSVKDGSDYESTAYCELSEETGYKANRLEYVGQFNPYNGITTEMCKVFIARSIEPAPAIPDETEEFENVLMTKVEIDTLINSNEIWDGMTMAAWLLARNRL